MTQMIKSKIAGICVAVCMSIVALGNINAEASGGVSAEQAADILLSTPVSGTLIQEDNSEWYAFKTNGFNSYYVVQMDCTSETGVEIAIFPDINKQSESYGMVVGGKGSLSQTVKFNQNQTYYIRVTNEEGAANGQYQLTVNEIRDDVSDTATEARWTEIEKVTGGYLEVAGDKDVYKLKVGRKDVPVRVLFQNLSVNGQMNFHIYSGSNLKDTQIVAKGQKVGIGASKYYEVMLQKNKVYYLVAEGNGSGNYQISFENLYTKLARTKTTVKASVSGKQARLTWNRMDYAHAYEVYVSTQKDGKYRVLSTISSRYLTSMTTSKQKKGTYYYKVCGVATVDIAGTGNTRIIRSAFSTPKKVVIK